MLVKSTVANEKWSAFAEIHYIDWNKCNYYKTMHLLNLCSHAAHSFGCFVPENPIIDEIECLKAQYENYDNLRNFSQFKTCIPKAKSSFDLSVYRAHQLWQELPYDMRKSLLLTRFKFKMSKRFCHHKLSCHFCKKYIKNVGYIK